ncbi:MAG: GNAT family N-acetyltransferase [Lachnospiraceae bacterium]|jgi:ribosomal protein S18 acetylase RimI-like enzyme|nr:GNAT family N-acetyltransferase [Lachnospiraceae bacterium]MCX4315559.1 GNAT family N-acetyltransferase [Lachnospiraceae bacterium]
MKHIDIWLRLPKPGEAEAIERILQQVQKLHIQMRPDIYKPVSPMMTEERLAALIEEKTALVAVCRQETEQEETIVAYADWMLREYQSPTHVFRRILYLDTLAVEEQWRGQGIGTRMLDWIKEHAREKGMDGIELQVNGRNLDARRMYERQGFGEKSVNMEIKL